MQLNFAHGFQRTQRSAHSRILLSCRRCTGGLYVAYLGVQSIRHRRDARAALDAVAIEPLSGMRALATGLTVGMTNPKTVVFFVAFLPQFVAGSHPAGPQLLVLGLIFAVLAVASDACWVLAASRAKAWFAREPKRLDRLGATGGVMMIGLGGVLLTAGNGS